MLEDYKLFENLQQAKKMLKDMNIPESDNMFVKLRELLKNNLGYMKTFTKWVYKDRESFDKIEEIFKKIKSVNNLDKQVDEFEKLEDLYDYLDTFESNKKVNQCLKSLPSRSRSLVNKELKDLIYLNSEDKIINSLKRFYSKKGGRYTEVGTLIKDTENIIKNLKGNWNNETIKKQFKGLNLEVVVDTPELLMARINDYATSKVVGSKFWCIVTSENMWNSYINGFTNQYFVWDFTKDIDDISHMIGTTVSAGGKITSAHWADDSPIRDLSVLDDL